MRIYITDAQVPELAPFPPAARRVLRRSTLQQMFAVQPWLRWLPGGFCLVGALMWLFAFPKLPFPSGDSPVLVLVSAGYPVLFTSLGGFIGAQFLIHRSRVYLRRLISSHSLRLAVVKPASGDI